MLSKIIRGVLILGFLGAYAQDIKDEVSVKYEFYDDNNGVTVHQELLRFAKSLGKSIGLSGHINIDGISGASRKGDISIRDSSLTLDGITASSIREIRKEYGGKALGKSGTSTLAAGFTRSTENDYESNSTSLDIGNEFFQKNSNLNLSYTLFDDNSKPEDTSLYQGGKKLTHSANVSWSQIFSKTTLATLTVGGNYSEGFLGRPYYHVWINDAPTPHDVIAGQPYKEHYPADKESWVGLLSVKQAFASFYKYASITMDYRFYTDSWSNQSHTTSATLAHYIAPWLLMKARYRLYNQSGVSFYQDVYTTADITGSAKPKVKFLTVDPKLAPFTSHLLSAKVAFISRNFIKPDTKGYFGLFPTQIDLEVQRYFRGTHENENIRIRHYESYGSGGLKAWVIRTGMVFAF